MKIFNGFFTKLKTQNTYAGQKWIFHLTDKDDKVLLHGHCCDKPWKLDGDTGIIYDVKTWKEITRLKEKVLMKLHQNEKFQEFTRQRIEWYNQENPNKPVKLPIWIPAKQMLHSFKTKKSIDEIIFAFDKKRILVCPLFLEKDYKSQRNFYYEQKER